jgi:hypothetical protein
VLEIGSSAIARRLALDNPWRADIGVVDPTLAWPRRSYFAQLISLEALSNNAGIAKPSIAKYLEYLECS